MYIVGHCFITERSRAFDDVDVYGDDLPLLMLPDFVNCHDWAYAEAWVASSPGMKLIQAHMLGDWYVHFGDKWRQDRHREGWAYRSMRPASATYATFFEGAAKLGLLKPDAERDTVRGFAHTMMEFSIDTHLARSGAFDEQFARAQAAIRGLDERDWLHSQLASFEITGSAADVEAVALDWRERALHAEDPSEFAYYAAARKFGLVDTRESIRYVEQYQNWLLTTQDSSELDGLCDAMARAIANPRSFFPPDAEVSSASATASAGKEAN